MIARLSALLGAAVWYAFCFLYPQLLGWSMFFAITAFILSFAYFGFSAQEGVIWGTVVFGFLFYPLAIFLQHHLSLGNTLIFYSLSIFYGALLSGGAFFLGNALNSFLSPLLSGALAYTLLIFYQDMRFFSA